MNIRHLEIFRAVVDAGSASGAGQYLGMSQPAISRAMKQLEDDLGFDLLSRSGGKLTPTSEGVRIHAELEKAFNGIDKVIASVRDAESMTERNLRLAVVPSLARGLIRGVLGRMMRRIPNLTVSLEVRSHRAVIELVASRAVDVGAASLPIHHPGIATESLTEPGEVCMMPSGHALEKYEVIRPEMLDGIDLIALNRRNHSRYRLDEVFRAKGVHPNIRMDVANTETALSMVCEGVGVAVVNALSARWYRNQDITIRPFEPELGYSFGLLYPQRQTRSEITMAFTEELKAYLAELGDDIKTPPPTPTGVRAT